jgi:hypothetical protein
MTDIAALIEPVARELWGDPNERLSHAHELRWGKHGGRMVRLDKGTWADHSEEHGSINSGGVLDLIARETGLDRKGAMDWLKQRGFSDDLPRHNGHSKPMLGREIASYDYLDEAGELLFQVVRFEPKDFRQRRRDETGKWTSSVRGVRQVPYRLPDLLETLAVGNVIFIAEGEKDVENLRALGIPATCNAGGAGKWREEFAPYFRAADVIVLQDNDIAGQNHVQDVAQKLQDVAERIRVVDIARWWQGMPAKGDVSDWIANGGTAEQLYAIAEKTPTWAGAPFVSRFGAQAWEHIGTAGAISCYAWLVEDVVPLGEIAMAFGDSGTGKSFAMFDLAMHIARDLKYNGRNVEPGLVVYVAAEGGKGFVKRKVAYAIQHQLEPSGPLPFVLLTKRPNFFQDDTDVMLLIEEIKAIKKRYSQRLVLIVIDTVSAVTPGMEENTGKDQSMVRKRFLMLQDTFGASVIVVHHKPKNGTTPRGHGSITADIETTIDFETVTDKKTSEGKRIHRATVRKQREGRDGISWEFTLPEIEVGRNKWGNPETTCVVQPHASSGPKPAKVGFHATPTELLFLRSLYDALVDHALPPPAGLPKSIAKVVHHKDIRASMRAKMIEPHEDNEVSDTRFRQAFKRAGDKLRDGGVIGVQSGLIWPTGKHVNGFSATEGP